MKSNMSKPTVFPITTNSLYIDHYLFFYMSSNFVQDLTNRLLTIERFVRDVQYLKNIWIKPLKNSNYYEILFPEAILLVSLSKMGIELNGIYDKSIRNHAQFIKEGVAVGLNKPILFFYDDMLQNKNIDKQYRSEEVKMEQTIVELLKTLSCIKQNSDAAVNHKRYEIEFTNWLNLYDYHSSLHLEANITSNPQIKYCKLATDPIFGPFSLMFYIDTILTFPLNHGQHFFLKTLKGEWVRALLQETFKDEKMSVIVLQFDRLYNIDDFPEHGDLFISFQTKENERKQYQIYYSQLNSTNVLKTLLSDQLSSDIDESVDLPYSILKKYRLDDEQKSIIKRAIGSKQLFYIDGAVSTGKSQILNCIRTYYESTNQRVLHITSNEHLSVDDKTFEATHIKNKIKQLTATTFEAISRLEAKIIVDKQKLTSYASDLLDLELALSEHEKLTQTLSRFYANLKSEHVNELTQLHDDIIEKENKLAELYAKLISDEKKIVETNKKSEFSKWLILPVIMNQKAVFKKRYLKFTSLTLKQAELIKTYNHLATKIKERLEDDDIVSKKEIWHLQYEHISRLRDQLNKLLLLDSIQLPPVNGKVESKSEIANKEEILALTNQLELMHTAINDYRQMIEMKEEHLFFSFVINENKSMQISMKLLHEHFNLFTNKYDIILIDDAHSYTLLELFLAISLGKKVIVTGDKHQYSLDVIQKRYSENMFKTKPLFFRQSAANILAKLLPQSLVGQLSFLYRVIPSLTLVYNQLIFAEDAYIRNKTDINPIKTLNNITNDVLILTTSQTKDRYEKAITDYSLYNHCEATTIIDLVVSILQGNSLLETRIKPEDILITSFFDMQIEYIRTHLRYVFPQFSKELIKHMVQPLSSCTGIERRVVFVSLCISNEMSANTRDLLNLRYSKLWNIALSRTREQLIIIGDIDYIKNTITNERRELNQTDYDWTSFDVANLIKTFLKIAAEGDIQLVPLEQFSKQLVKVTGGFGYEQYVE